LRDEDVGVVNVVAANLPYLLEGALATVRLSLTAAPLAVVLGAAAAILRLYGPAPVRAMSVAYIEIFRGTPALVQMFFAFFALPLITGLQVSAFTAAILALVLNSGAYFAEIVRGGLQAVSRGQWEAASALGLTFAQVMRTVIVPQAIRRIVAPAVGQFTILVKDTSIASVIAVFELTRAGQHIVERTLSPFEIFSVVGLLYFLVCYGASSASRRLERRMDGPGERSGGAWRYVIGER
jgi:His/Glu/Gln/Arg/opine family amino acid ABC transporter permease subunit